MATQLQARETPETMPLEEIDVSRAELYRDDAWRPWFARLRAEAPVHRCENSLFGPYWSVCRHEDIMEVEAKPELFSSSHEHGGITIIDLFGEYNLPQFIALDRPRHSDQRRVVAPAFKPAEMARLSGEIRQRTGEILDSLPVGETFDWVDRVSIELTTQMLAILFDFPWEDRRKLTLWSDWAGDIEAAADPAKAPIRLQHLRDMLTYFDRLLAARKSSAPTSDLLTMMVHSEALGNLDDKERMGNLVLLIVGGNDTTRNSMSGAVHAFHQYPDQWRKLLDNPELVGPAVPEVVRWQTPLSHMRRTATADTQIAGHSIAKGDKIILWYLAANHDDRVFEDAERLIVDRPNARRHLAFGFGIHRCVGARLAELQLQILFEEMIARGMSVVVVGEPVYVAQCFVHGYRSLPVRIAGPSERPS